MSHDLVIKNGLVILENGEVETDVAVKDGIISAIGKDLTGAHTIDASGLEPHLAPKAALLHLWKCR